MAKSTWCKLARHATPSSSAAQRRCSITVRDDFGSRLAMGSSASMSSGSCTSARAMPTRCFCPPDSWSVRAYAKSARPTWSRISNARRFSSSLNRPSMPATADL